MNIRASRSAWLLRVSCLAALMVVPGCAETMPPTPVAIARVSGVLMVIAERVVIGTLRLVQDAGSPLVVEVGGEKMLIGGGGHVIPQREIERVLQLNGRLVAVGVETRQNMLLVLDEDGVAALVGIQEAASLMGAVASLEDTDWRRETLAWKTGEWGACVDDIGEIGTMAARHRIGLLRDSCGASLLRDICAWYVNNKSIEEPFLEPLMVGQEFGLVGGFKSPQFLALAMMGQCLRLSPNVFIRSCFLRQEHLRKLWIISRLFS